MSRLLYIGAATCLVLAIGCQNEEFTGPGGTRSEPTVFGGRTFDDDNLSVTVETFAQSAKYEPQIMSVRIYVNDEPFAAEIKPERVQESAGFCQKITFAVSVDAKKVRAELVVRHMDQLYQVTVPFEHTRIGSIVKWRRDGQKVQNIGIADNRPSPEAVADPIRF